MNTLREVLLLKYGELILKGHNRPYFEGLLIKDIQNRLKRIGRFETKIAQSTVYILPCGEEDQRSLARAEGEMERVFGIASICRALEAPKDLNRICDLLPDYVAHSLLGAKTFKVEAKRSDKKFQFSSPEICATCGERLLEAFPHLSVDVHSPDIVVWVEIRDFAAYLHAGVREGAGGLPCGCAGKAVLLLSGGIDSPAAGYVLARRGLLLHALHFESYPYTSERAKEKVVSLAKIMSVSCGRMTLTCISVTKIQEAIKKNCRQEYFTILLRRFMMRLAEKTARVCGAGALITGESLGQVASQTMEAIGVTNAAVHLPVFRPFIAMDKEEIVRIARRIDTFETSILPYEDCCTVFTPRHPVIRPVLELIEKEEAKLDVDGLVEQAFQARERIPIGEQ